MMLVAFADASTRKHVDERKEFILYVVLGPVTHQSEGTTSRKPPCEKKLKPRLVRIYRIVLGIKNGMSSTNSVEVAVIKTAGWEVKDVKFVDDDEMVLAVSTKCKPACAIVLARRFISSKTSLSCFPALQNPIPRNIQCLRWIGICHNQR